VGARCAATPAATAAAASEGAFEGTVDVVEVVDVGAVDVGYVVSVLGHGVSIGEATAGSGSPAAEGSELVCVHISTCHDR
jgi:hypothetical protein